MKKVYVIGEIGQNHNGSVDIAKLIIDVVARPVIDNQFGTELRIMDAVKLTKRDLKAELSDTAMKKEYNSVNSFGKTYGEHRAKLELNDEQHHELYKYAKDKNLDFVETLCAVGCLSLLKLFYPDYLKVASRDLTNLPLLEAMAETKIPIIVSTGMAGKEELDQALETISKFHTNVTILHCLSQYPSEYQNINLNTIKFLQKNYGQYRIGYSDHSIGIAIPLAAVAMGAEVIEKHITIDRNMKGTDQAGSLGIDGIYRMMRDIRNLELAFGDEKMYIDPSVKTSQHKLERSIATNKFLKAGSIVLNEDIHLLSPGDGFKWVNKDQVIGKKLIKDIEKNEIIYSQFLQS